MNYDEKETTEIINIKTQEDEICTTNNEQPIIDKKTEANLICDDTTAVNVPVVDVSNVKNSKKSIIIILSLLVALIILGLSGFFIYTSVIVPNNQYDQAITELENENYDKAISAFKKMGDYKDSKNMILEAYYEKGKSLFDEGSYSEAITAFEKAGNYEDTKDKLAEAKEQAELQSMKLLFSTAYSSCSSSNTTLSSDGLSICIDGEDKYDTSSYYDVATVITVLGLPDSLGTEMDNTNSLMGVQTETYDNIEVRWSYHPDNGLDVIFKIIS